MKNIVIVGYGTIGKLEASILSRSHELKVDIIDPKYNLSADPEIVYDLAVICVPTPNDEEGRCDTSLVKSAILNTNAKVYLIKSTVIPGTTNRLIIETHKHIVMSPEHSGATQHCTDFNYDFTILGGDIIYCQYVQQIYQYVYNAYHKFMFVDAATAELSKYMLNAYLATKVTFCNEFAMIAQCMGVSYEQLRECFVLDPRVEPSHTFVYDEAPYWDSHCFNKDIPAIAHEFNSKLLKTIIEINNDAKNKLN